MAKRENDLGRDPIGKLLLRLAVPTVPLTASRCSLMCSRVHQSAAQWAAIRDCGESSKPQTTKSGKVIFAPQ